MLEKIYSGCISREGKTKAGKRKCSRISIAQVKKKYKQKEGKWVKRNYVDNRITPEMMCNCKEMWDYKEKRGMSEVQLDLNNIEENATEIRLPITLTRQGVMNGTFKPNEELKQTTWYDGMRLFLDHISEPRGRTEKEYYLYIGHVEDVDYGYDKKEDEVTIEGTAVLYRRKLNKMLVDELKNGNVPVSIEYWRNLELLETSEIYKNKEYFGIERDIHIDDVAIMYSQEPACDIGDGCGIGLNKADLDVMKLRSAIKQTNDYLNINKTTRRYKMDNEEATKLAEMLVNEELIPEGKYDKYVNKLSEYFATNAIVRKLGELTEVVKNKDEKITKLKEENEELKPLAEVTRNAQKEELDKIKEELIKLNEDSKEEYEKLEVKDFERAKNELEKIKRIIEKSQNKGNGEAPAIKPGEEPPKTDNGLAELKMNWDFKYEESD